MLLIKTQHPYLAFAVVPAEVELRLNELFEVRLPDADDATVGLAAFLVDGNFTVALEVPTEGLL